MPTIIFSLNDLWNLVGKKISIEEIESLASNCKGELENYDSDSDEVKMAFEDTNLPYLWSVEGFARFLKNYFEIQKGIPKIKIKKADYGLIVDKSVIKYRPFIACFVAKGKKLDDYLLKQIIQLQEKFCDSYGRKRQKVSVGLYSYKRVTFPLHYKAALPKSLEFVPLEFKAKMNLKEILTEHPKGKEYAYILDGFEKYPVLLDDKNEVLSFIPVINSNFTGKLEVGDENIFFEATGTDEHAVNLCANIFAYVMSERGFELSSVEVKYPDRKVLTPTLSEQSIKISEPQIKGLFGIELKESEIKKLAERAQYDFDKFKITIPPYRGDILHPYDVIEDIGIIYGYDNIEERPLETFTQGQGLEVNSFIDKIRDTIAGFGFQETLSPILTNKNLLYNKMNAKDKGTVEIDEFMSETYSVVRSWILPCTIDILSKNTHVSYPQKIFEEGIVNTRTSEEILEFNKLAIASAHESANYTEIRQILDFIIKSLGLKVDYEDAVNSSFIEGRCAIAIVKGKKIATLGEISPVVLQNFGIEVPVSAMEINMTGLFEIVKNK
ncbi:MAG TPA: phenylalanine--tRNA ligase subunit beta [Candidatus Nanoarchaeia archaeon]|nr:phenylalanine--tRNA ligase subunit beta [Candidatus Nanoarchaeia archaeon]